MSRIGKEPITIPKGTKVAIEDGCLVAEGPKGKVSEVILEGLSVVIEEDAVRVSRAGDSAPERSRHGLMRSLLANAVEGVTNGFTKNLEINGVGYRAEVKGGEVHFALGFSHPVIYSIPQGISIIVDKSNKVTVTGADRQKVGQVAAEIRKLRKPDPYKGKGIKYADEVLRRKVGKAGAGAK
ncbi:MAG TPA: 50S ribosomal protein L6 [Thermoanaerobaculia bacterium]|nr:50S ribosomal protein L6 [Thermoanaerobaculia bacterium]